MKSRRPEQDGGVLAMVLMAWLVLAGLAFAAVTMVVRETRTRGSEINLWQACYLAQAGVERGIAVLAQDTNRDWSDNAPGETWEGRLGPGRYSVEITPVRKDRAILFATGRSGASVWTVRAVVAINWRAARPRVTIQRWEEPDALRRVGL